MTQKSPSGQALAEALDYSLRLLACAQSSFKGSGGAGVLWGTKASAVFAGSAVKTS